MLTATAAVLIGLLAGCAEGASPVGDVAADGGTGMGGAHVTFTQVWNEVLVAKSCTNALCHGATPPMGNLSLADQASAYLNLVNAPASGPSCASGGMFRVRAGMPDASVLVQKLSSTTPSCGTAMPPSASIAPMCTTMTPTSCNTAAEIKLVRDWISGGAMND